MHRPIIHYSAVYAPRHRNIGEMDRKSFTFAAAITYFNKKQTQFL